MNERRYPDIEIYLKDPDIPALLAWLRTVFPDLEVRGESPRHHLHLGGGSEALLFENAVKGRFASLWFKENSTPWPTDLDCARAAFRGLGAEVRCSTSPWDPGDSDSESGDDDAPGWIRLDDRGEHPVRWQT